MMSPATCALRSWVWAGVLAAAGAGIAAQKADPATPAAGVYSAEQAQRGARLYAVRCETCHKVEQFTGPEFLLSWNGQPAINLFTLIRTTMPTGSPSSLKRQEYADILAYLLEANGLPPGPAELAGTDEALKRTIIAAPSTPTRRKGL